MSIMVIQKLAPPKRGVVKQCELCERQFGFLKAEHQCKRCFRAVCQGCGRNKCEVYMPSGSREKHRICNWCFQQSNSIRKCVEDNKLVFAQDSIMGRKWEELSREFVVGEEMGDKRQGVGVTVQGYKEIWDGQNFSLKDLVGMLTCTRKMEEVHKQVNAVYVPLQEAGVAGESPEGVVLLVTFMLCFTQPATCLKILKQLLRLLRDGRPKLEAYFSALQIREADIKKLEEYRGMFRQSINGVLINTITVECSVELINRIMKTSQVQEIYMSCAVLVKKNLKYLLSNKNSESGFDFVITRNCKLQYIAEKQRYFANANALQFVAKTKTENTESKNNDFDESPTFLLNQLNGFCRTFTDNRIDEEDEDEPNGTTEYQEMRTKSQNEFAECDEISRKNQKVQDMQVVRLVSAKQLSFLKKSGRSSQKDKRKSSSAESELKKSQEENLRLKNKIGELETTAKMLKNRLESLELLVAAVDVAEDQPDGARVLQMLKKQLEEKTQALQDLLQKNRILEYQVKSIAEDQQSHKTAIPRVINEAQYLSKIQELVLAVDEERAEKKQLREQLAIARNEKAGKDGNGKWININVHNGCSPF